MATKGAMAIKTIVAVLICLSWVVPAQKNLITIIPQVIPATEDVWLFRAPVQQSGDALPPIFRENMSSGIKANEVKQEAPLNQKPCYTLTVQPTPTYSGNVTIQPPPNCPGEPGSYLHGTEVSLIASENTGYQFVSWSGDVSGVEKRTTVLLTENWAIAANFEPICYTLKTSVNPEGSGTIQISTPPNCKGANYTYGTQVSVMVSANPDYKFSSWLEDIASTSTNGYVLMTGDRTATAHFVSNNLSYLGIPPRTNAIYGDDPVNAGSNDYTLNLIGSDANQDGMINVGDISCAVLIKYNGSDVCSADGQVITDSDQSLGPDLTIPSQIQSTPGTTVTVPITYLANGNSISSTTFSIDFDQSLLNFDPTDGNGDGIPDSVTFHSPATFNANVSYDASDTDGEMDFFIADMMVPLASLPDGVLANITFTIGNPESTTDATIGFSTDPIASFGNNVGQSVSGTTHNGSVHIFVEPPPQPQLSLSNGLEVAAGSDFDLFVTYVSNGAEVSSMAFSINFDQNTMLFDPTDYDNDGIPDSIGFNLPPGFSGNVSVDLNDADGELDFVIADLMVPLSSMPNTQLIRITFTALEIGDKTIVPILFSQDPIASFGDIHGNSLPGGTSDGLIIIKNLFKRYFPLIGGI